MVKATLEIVSSTQHALTVEVPPMQVAKSRETILLHIAKEMKLPGFRPGKIPPHVVEKQLGSRAREEIIQQIIRDSYPDAVQTTGARPLSDPQVQPGDFQEGKLFTYRAVFEVFPEITVGDVKGLKLEKEEIEVYPHEIDAEVERLRHKMTQLEPAKGEELKEGFMALVDFEGTADGKSFDGCKAKDFIVDVGSGGLLPAFEKEMTGMKDGEKRTITFEYPSTYYRKEVAGKKGVFDIHVKEVRRKVVPELDDHFAQSLGSFETLREVRDDIKRRITEAKEKVERQKLHRQAVEKLVEKYPLDVPEVMIATEISSMLEGISRRLEAVGQTLADAKIDPKEFVKANHAEARIRASGTILASAVAKEQGLKVDEAEKNDRLSKIAASSQRSVAEVRDYFEKNRIMRRLETEILLEKALDFVVGHSKIKVVKPKKGEERRKKEE